MAAIMFWTRERWGVFVCQKSGYDWKKDSALAVSPSAAFDLTWAHGERFGYVFL